MIQEGKCYRVIKEDEELINQFPEFKIGAEFKVIHVLTRFNSAGVVSVQFRGGAYMDIRHSRDSWFWCFYCVGHKDDEGALVEIEELSSDQIDVKNKVGVINGVHVKDLLIKRIVDGGSVVDQELLKYINQLEKHLEFSDRGF